ncbi:amidohydrolase [Metabacillus idriensis]|uniref:Amidohydrolase family protein n=1 Tax=Metabacillus idriensis TaxID=324768 RepID=A0A6I2MBQ4_9BACI|nr:amidohydrolase [Metabacillus idriensis]MCM3595730.1 amidohydrolase [Metabacillus idriensis]MRX53841.1 amidohydrolase family protein [Metabacillus idriensis]OHR64565.1 amidohydrolase [Bacillus sp. HMSC76G11]
MKADFVFINGEVLTVDETDGIAEAAAVQGSRIMAVGSNDTIREYITDETTVIDLNGKTLMPGFIDAHIHLTIYGTNLLGVSCTDPSIQSLSDLFEALRKKAKETPPGQWIRATEFNEGKLTEQRYPTKQELDQLSTEHPIVIVRTCNHTSIANSKALEMAKISRDTKDPEGGIIERFPDGELTGKLIENAHMQLFQYAGFSENEVRKGMKLASDAFIKAGITSVHDAGGYGDGADTLRIMQQAVQSNDIRVRVYAMIGSLTSSHDFVRKMLEAGPITGLGNDRFKIGPAKVFTDGSSVGPTIATREPYTHSSSDYGILYYTQEELNRILGEAHKKGFQITAHAQGDRAIEMLLNCFEKALNDFPRHNHRHRIEHAGIASNDLQERIKDLEVVVTPNPVFMYANGDKYLEYYGDRVNVMYPARGFLEKDIIAAFGSDAPVTFLDPLLGIHAAVNRESSGGSPVGKNQCLSVLEAIRAYTWNGAYASFEETSKGSIEAQKLADFVVLSESILKVDKKEIKNVKVVLTMINGEILYDSQNLLEKGKISKVIR